MCIVNFVIYSFSQGQKQSSLGTFTKCLLKRSFLCLRPLEYQNWSVENFSKTHVTSISCTSEPAIPSCDTGQRVPYFDSCQLIIKWMSNIKLNTICIQCLYLGLKTCSKTLHIRYLEGADGRYVHR